MRLLSTSLLLATTATLLTGTEIGSWGGKAWVDKYIFFNNTFNMSKASSGSWMVTFYNPGQISANWGGKWDVGSANWNDVKGFPSCCRGWHWGTWSSNSGLSRAVNSLPQITVDWWARRDWAENSRFNMSIDLWGTNVPDNGYNNPSQEIMIWYAWNGVNPIGSYQSDVFIAGESWEKWAGNGGAGYYTVTYRKKSQSYGRNGLPLRDFIQNAGTMNGKYLAAIEAGWEAFTGKAQWTTTWYNVSGL